MHEMSLAQDIVASVREHVGTERLRSVTKVRIEIGAASGVVSESLQFAFDAIIQNSSLSAATMESTIIPFVVHCYHCGKDSQNDGGYMLCSECDSSDVAIVSGAELILKQIELKEM
ncbi:MAG: hydrogenase maturation nickel metallochaperone HypA [Ignavibacteriales bacterium]|nr:hydrogenase maturation nickel metallochaperone HypA [Ignavibacteriales bacterium]